ncbi:MAG: hypothetical protein U1D30_12635 [Planctomycetota bacterium]
MPLANCDASIAWFVVLGILGCSSKPGKAGGRRRAAAPLEKGEKRLYDFIKTTERTQGGSLAKKSTSESELEIEVQEVHSDGYTLVWTTRPKKVDVPKDTDPALADDVQRFAKEMRIVLRVGSNGSVQKVENWQEIQAYLISQMEQADAVAAKAGQSAEQRDKMRSELSRMFGTEAQVTALAGREPTLFFSVLGKTFSASKPLQYQDSLPSPFGGDPIATLAAYTVVSQDAEKDLTTIRWQQATDPDAMSKSLEKSMREMAERLKKPVPPDYAFPKNSVMKDEADFVVNSETGWIDSLVQTRTMSIGPELKVDNISIRVRPN